MNYLKTSTNFIVFVVVLSACTSVDSATRRKNRFQFLKGEFLNTPVDTLGYNQLSLALNFSSDTSLTKREDLNVEIIPADKKHIRLIFKNEDSVYSDLTLKGKYRNGFFKMTHWWSDFPAGPAFWALGSSATYIGITKENNLVVFKTAGSAFAFVLVVPFFASSGRSSHSEYLRIK